jgi:glycosyltransferase involved in cell wall biosynthesis
MNVLLSAYACNPARGGEENIGFNWMHEWHHADHNVWCLTTPAGRPSLDAYVNHLGLDDKARLHIEYVQVPKVIEYLYRWQFGVYLHYIVWQFLAWRIARRLTQYVTFDLVHHTSYSSLQMASWLWRLGRPMVLGPLGGGQHAPIAFKRYVPDWFKTETLRNVIAWLLITFDPNVRKSIQQATLVLTTNSETAAKVKELGGRQVHMFLDSGLPADFLPNEFPVRPKGEVMRILWLGRLVTRKALPLVLEALGQVNPRVPFHLTIVGDGVLGQQLPDLIRYYGLEGRVTWTGMLPWTQVHAMYLSHDVFMFASLRDSFAMQLLEAMGAGLPIITLDHQGARDFIPAAAAIKAPVTTPTETVAALAQAVEFYYDNPAQRAAMGRVGYAFARTQTWPLRSRRLQQMLTDLVSPTTPSLPSVAAEQASISYL